MAIRTSEADWRGDLKGGRGEIRLGSGAFSGNYSFQSRFEEGQGTNPEELIAAAHAGCFSMALSANHGHFGSAAKACS
jgi:osmotically inducible protein OsmC